MIKVIKLIKGITIKILNYGRFKVGKHFFLSRGACVKAYSGSKILIGNNCSVNDFSSIVAVDKGSCVEIEDKVSINRFCVIIAKQYIKIGAKTAIGPHVLIYDHDHSFSCNGIEAGFKKSPVEIGSNVWIGGGCIILRGTKIGDNCVIGAGTVVSGIIPPNSLVKNKARELIIEKLI